MSGQDFGETEEALRERFQALRAEDRRGAPDVAAMLERARAEIDTSRALLGERPEPLDSLSKLDEPVEVISFPPSRVRLPLLVGTLAAAAFAGLMFIGQGTTDDFDMIVQQYAQGRSTGLWESPTAGLMDVPGMEFVRAMPSVGRGLGTSLTAPGHAGVKNDT